jgi:malate dehydrogenase (oxaloacetate-decarboxylating)(NADP+)
MKIPVFHDDQHGTAIIVGAAVLNALKLVGKQDRRGQAGHQRRRRRRIACLNLMVKLGVPRENIWVDRPRAWSTKGRDRVDGPRKQRYASPPRRARWPR